MVNAPYFLLFATQLSVSDFSILEAFEEADILISLDGEFITNSSIEIQRGDAVLNTKVVI